MLKTTIAVLATSLALNAHAIRQGVSVTVSPSNLGTNNVTPVLTYGSIWYVYYGALNRSYTSNNGTACIIVKTGNSYSIKVSAFSKTFVYVQTQAGELSLTKTEYVPVSKTVRRVLVWTFNTAGNTATSSCTVEVQMLSKGVWKTTTPATVWLKSYTSTANMDTVIN